jgi:hypothetical protein
LYANSGSSYWRRNVESVRKCSAEEDIWTKLNEVRGARRRSSKEELHDLYLLFGDEIEANAMTGACGTYGGEGRDHLEHLGIYWNIILKHILKK